MTRCGEHRPCQVFTFLFDLTDRPVQTLRFVVAAGSSYQAALKQARAALDGILEPREEFGLVDSTSGAIGITDRLDARDCHPRTDRPGT